MTSFSQFNPGIPGVRFESNRGGSDGTPWTQREIAITLDGERLVKGLPYGVAYQLGEWLLHETRELSP